MSLTAKQQAFFDKDTQAQVDAILAEARVLLKDDSLQLNDLAEWSARPFEYGPERTYCYLAELEIYVTFFWRF